MVVQGEGLLSFCEGCGDGGGRCNGRGKPTPLRKASGIVRFLKGWCGARDGAKKAVTVGVAAAVKHSCITFNECRKLNIKNPLFT